MWGLISVAALAAAPPSAVPLDSFLKDVPGVTAAPTLPVNSKVDGVDIQQRMVRSTKSPYELREFFGSAFLKAGLYIPPEQDTISAQVGVQITGLDTDHLMSYTALLQPAGKGGTTIVLAVANLGKKTALIDPIAPVFPGGTSVTSYNLESTKAMTYSAVATPAEIKTFYFQTLTAAGYKDGTEPDTYLRGNQLISINISPGMTEQGILVKLETITGPPAKLPPLPKQMPTELPNVTVPRLPDPSQMPR